MVRVENAPLPSRSGSTQAAAAHIRVVVRVRPPNLKERDQNHRTIIDVVDNNLLVFDPKENQTPFFYQGVQQPNRNFLKRPNKELKFMFDYVCGPSKTNNDVFESTTKDILTALMAGYNCSVFVYGATGAGKTFTMIGTKENPGITYLTMDRLFQCITSYEHDTEFKIGVSYLEVYNENVYDLLKPSKTPLQLREDNKYGVMVAGLSCHNIKTAQELLNMLEDGNKNRTQHPTDANAESSRSHAVFQVYLTMKCKTSTQVRMVKLSMIDLAGSERAAATGCVGERFKEGANINRSLLSLGNCINKLADGNKFIPYRDSKLTRLLKDSLGGNCRTVMIANVSPSSLSYEDTYNTLKYAARAKKIQISAKQCIVQRNVRGSEYVRVNEELRKKVAELEARLAASQHAPAPPAAAAAPAAAPAAAAAREKEKAWRGRLAAAAREHAALEQTYLGLCVRRRVLALRRRLRARAAADLRELAHTPERDSAPAMDELCSEDIPRHARAAESYAKQTRALDRQITAAWAQWDASQRRLDAACARALAECPELEASVALLRAEASLRRADARAELVHKLLCIENGEVASLAAYTGEMAGLLKRFYRTLWGYNKVSPETTAEYLQVMRKSRAARGISWADEGEDAGDAQFRFITTLDMERPTACPDGPDGPGAGAGSDSDAGADSDAADENAAPGVKRKGTPIKLENNDTIVIDDSLVLLDSTHVISSAKKLKNSLCASFDAENRDARIDPDSLNSTFVLAGKVEALKKEKAARAERGGVERSGAERGLVDRTNTRPIQFEDKVKARPIVSRVLPSKRPAAAGAAAGRGAAGGRPGVAVRPGFGSSLTRDGTPLQKQAVRGRQRVQTHPYSRPDQRV